MIVVNGKEYPLWSQFIDRKNEWIGGVLQELEDSFPIVSGEQPETIIIDIQLNPNGDDSAYYSVVGKEFSCGFDVGHGGIIGGEEGWMTFSGYGGHVFRIKKQEVKMRGG